MQLSPAQARLALLVAALVIAGLAVLPADADAPTLIGLDKLKHAGAFLVLTVLARASWPALALWPVVLGLAGFGALIEIAQAVTGWGRTASVADMLADLAGVGLALALLVFMKSRRKRTGSNPS